MDWITASAFTPPLLRQIENCHPPSSTAILSRQERRERAVAIANCAIRWRRASSSSRGLRAEVRPEVFLDDRARPGRQDWSQTPPCQMGQSACSLKVEATKFTEGRLCIGRDVEQDSSGIWSWKAAITLLRDGNAGRHGASRKPAGRKTASSMRWPGTHGARHARELPPQSLRSGEKLGRHRG